MHVSTGTDVRIIDMEGTIIIVEAVNTTSNLYRVLVDGIFCGFVEHLNEVLIPTPGSNIKSVYLDKIVALRSGDSTKMKAIA